jgi:hypothetical protein
MTHSLVEALAIYLDTIPQVPAIVPCLQNTPEPEWRFWVGAIAPWVGPILSGFVSIYVAWKVFRWQGRKDHQQWVLENKKREWQELISLAAEIEKHMPSVGIGNESIAAVKGSSLDQHLRNMTEATLRCIFIASAADRQRIYDQLVQVQVAKDQAHTNMVAYEQSPSLATQQGRPRPLEIALEFRSKFAGVWNDVHAMATKDLGID